MWFCFRKKKKSKNKSWLGYSEKFHIGDSIVHVKLGKRAHSPKRVNWKGGK